MNTDAAMQTFAAPPTPWRSTALAIKGTVALAVPPMRTGFRPKRAVMGAVVTEVTRPRTGGRPIKLAIANPYGSAMSAAMAPPERSPAKIRQLYGIRESCTVYLGGRNERGLPPKNNEGGAASQARHPYWKLPITCCRPWRKLL